jgi:hypothetical protein
MSVWSSISPRPWWYRVNRVGAGIVCSIWHEDSTHKISVAGVLRLLIKLSYGVTLRAKGFMHTGSEMVQRSRGSSGNYSWISRTLSLAVWVPGFPSVICPRAVT